MMRLFGNILWIIFGGAEMALCWAVAALIFALSIVGLPWARSAATIAWFTIWPFGRYAVDRETVTGEEDLGTGALGFVGNVIFSARGHLACDRSRLYGRAAGAHDHRDSVCDPAPEDRQAGARADRQDDPRRRLAVLDSIIGQGKRA
jgi:hypothetical protein